MNLKSQMIKSAKCITPMAVSNMLSLKTQIRDNGEFSRSPDHQRINQPQIHMRLRGS